LEAVARTKVTEIKYAGKLSDMHDYGDYLEAVARTKVTEMKYIDKQLFKSVCKWERTVKTVRPLRELIGL
jgi:hypothetical protein